MGPRIREDKRGEDRYGNEILRLRFAPIGMTLRWRRAVREPPLRGKCGGRWSRNDRWVEGDGSPHLRGQERGEDCYGNEILRLRFAPIGMTLRWRRAVREPPLLGEMWVTTRVSTMEGDRMGSRICEDKRRIHHASLRQA